MSSAPMNQFLAVFLPREVPNRFKVHRAGFPCALEGTKIDGYTCHCNRHTFASRLFVDRLWSKVDLHPISGAFGHRKASGWSGGISISLRNIRPSLIDRLVEGEKQKDKKSDIRGSAAKAMKSKNVASN
jgi:hypothetical protein